MAERGGVEPTASEAPDAPESLLTISDVAKVLKELEKIVDWYHLGTYLEVEAHDLEKIRCDNPTSKHRMIKMLEQWLRNGRDCSWTKLVEALYLMGKIAVADAIRRKHLTVTTPVLPQYLSGHDPSAAPEARALLAQKNKQRLKSKFSSLVKRMSTRMTELNINLVLLQTYLTTFGCEHERFVDDVLHQDSLPQLFSAVSRHKLWDYLNFDLTQDLVEEFAKGDKKCVDLIAEYQCAVTGFLLTSEIVHHLSAVKKRGEGSTATPPEDISSEELCSKLTVKLNIDVTTHSLKYVEEVWKTLLKRSQLPKHTLLLREIAKSSLVITWLLPKSKAGEVADAVWQNEDELQLKRVVLVTIDGVDIFQADPIKVDDELQSLVDTIEADLGRQLMAAAREGRVGLVASQLEQGAGVNSSKDEGGYTPLVAGCEGGSIEVVKLLIEHGADVNLRAELTDGSGTITPLCMALVEGHEEVAVLLMEHGADVHAVGVELKLGDQATISMTPLIIAVGKDSQHAARLLLQRGAEVDKEVEATGEGETLSTTALMGAANVEVATLLLEHGAQVNLQGSRGGHTALMWASDDGRYEVAQLLLERGAAVDLQGDEGKSALMGAVKKRDDKADKDRVGLARLLLQHGANPQLQDGEGNTPLSLAVEQGDAELIELLTDPAKASSSDHTPQQPPDATATAPQATPTTQHPPEAPPTTPQQPLKAPPTTPQQHGKAPRRKQGKRSIFGKIRSLSSNLRRSRSREVFLK